MLFLDLEQLISCQLFTPKVPTSQSIGCVWDILVRDTAMVFWSFQPFNVITGDALENELRGVIRIELDETSLMNPLDDLVIQLVDTVQENGVVTSAFLPVSSYIVSEESYALGTKITRAYILDSDRSSSFIIW